MHSAVQFAFSVLILVQFLMVTLHDWVNIPGWTHGKQVQAVVGRGKFALITLANGIFPGLAVAFIFRYRGVPKPSFVTGYWVIYCAITVASAVTMWWIPYFFGSDAKTKQQYAAMYAGTVQVLSPRGDNPRPNLLHLGFHALFLLTLGLAIALRLS
jgi:hypothetical protein